jgi:hypothetical protein
MYSYELTYEKNKFGPKGHLYGKKLRQGWVNTLVSLRGFKPQCNHFNIKKKFGV